MAYIDLRGHKVWSVEGEDNGAPLLLLHGGLSSTESFDWQVMPAVGHRFHVYGYDRTAHGRTPVREGYYHFDFQTDEAISYIEDVIGGPTHIIGHSDGRIIALMVALKRPDLVLSIVAGGTNYHWDCGLDFFDEPIIISEEDKAKFAERSPEPAYMQEVIIKKAYEIWAKEPNMTQAQISTITCPVLVLNGDDEPFDNHHGIDLYEALPNGRLAIIPGTSHAVLKEKNEICLAIITDFYDHPEMRGEMSAFDELA